jgi:lipid-binding SYLF domain-containing protein
VYRAGKLIAKTTVTSVSIGLGAGGEAYTEIIFFKDKAALDRFIEGKVELGARANAVAGQAAVSGELAYENGVAIFTVTKGGLMADASVGGQKFSYEKL